MVSILSRVIAGGLLVASLAGLGYNYGYHSADSKWSTEVKNDYITKQKASELERASVQAAVDRVSQQYQDDLSALEGSTDGVINGLRDSNKRLLVKLKATGPKSATSDNCGRQPDGRAELDEGTSRQIIEVTQRGDAWIKALQGTIRELQAREVSSE